MREPRDGVHETFIESPSKPFNPNLLTQDTKKPLSDREQKILSVLKDHEGYLSTKEIKEKMNNEYHISSVSISLIRLSYRGLVSGMDDPASTKAKPAKLWKIEPTK